MKFRQIVVRDYLILQSGCQFYLVYGKREGIWSGREIDSLAWIMKLFEMYQRAAFILRRYVELGVGMD